jgi:hypothetical protein
LYSSQNVIRMIKEDEMNGAYGVNGREENFMQGFGGET